MIANILQADPDTLSFLLYIQTGLPLAGQSGNRTLSERGSGVSYGKDNDHQNEKPKSET
jgi:hypothetical protein